MGIVETASRSTQTQSGRVPALDVVRVTAIVFVMLIHSPIGDHARQIPLFSLSFLGAATFWIYAVHEPSQTILAKIWHASGLPFYDSGFCFLAIPAVVFGASLAAYQLLRRYCAWALPVMTGGR